MQAVADAGIVEHSVTTHALEHDLRRDVALAESRHLQVAADGPRRAVQLVLDRVWRDLHVHVNARVAKLASLRRHRTGHGGGR